MDPNAPKHEDTEIYEPVPPVVTPGATDSQPPSDAIVLFDGKNLDQWVMNKDKSPAVWTVADGILTVKKGRDSGNIETKRTLPRITNSILSSGFRKTFRAPIRRGNSGGIPRFHRPRR